MLSYPRAGFALLLLTGIIACDSPGGEMLAPDAADLGLREAPALTVMSQNLYLGADIDLLLSGADPSTVIGGALQQLQQTNFGARAWGLAAEIVAAQPHLVGLQEVTHYEIPPALGLGTAQIDYLQILVAYIGFLGGDYHVAVHQPNLDITLPVVLGGQYLGDVRYQDGDAILVRGDVQLESAAAAHFTTQQLLSVAGASFYNLHGWNAVVADVDGLRVRFVNTHLEIQRFRDVQEAQAAELVELFEGEDVPVIMVGDFNSAANPHADPAEVSDSYRLFRNAGFADIWLREPHSNVGLTCCQDPVLSNETSELYSRLDLVLVRWGTAGFGGQTWMDVVGDAPDDRVPATPGSLLWPSDHAGVVASLWPAPGRVEATD